MKNIIHSNENLIWYASYGSNMDARRFLCYIVGGTPVGGSRNYAGCDDKSLPLADTEIELPYQLYFASESKAWTGGLAFIGHATSADTTKARAYLVTTKQFEQIVAQESWRDESLPIDIGLLQTLDRLTTGDGTGNYDELIYCGEHGSHPVVSFTSPIERRPFTKPSPAYLRMIANGLFQSHRLDVEGTVEYLLRKPGIFENYSREKLAAVIS